MRIGQMEEVLPLTPSEFYILVALAHGSSYGSELIKRIERDSEGVIEAMSGTVYPLLARLTERSMISEVPGKDAKLRRYKLTSLGRQIMVMEMGRLERLCELGRERLS